MEVTCVCTRPKNMTKMLATSVGDTVQCLKPTFSPVWCLHSRLKTIPAGQKHYPIMIPMRHLPVSTSSSVVWWWAGGCVFKTDAWLKWWLVDEWALYNEGVGWQNNELIGTKGVCGAEGSLRIWCWFVTALVMRNCLFPIIDYSVLRSWRRVQEEGSLGLSA